MAVTLNVNGNYYYYPEQGDLNWGTDATDWAVAVTGGMLQKAGGSFILQSEVDFGANYGLKSLYYKSRTTNPATSGQIRLAVSDTISFRNNANSGNLALSVNGSDQLLFNGSALGGVWGSITGTLSSQTDLQTALNAKVAGPASATDNALVRFDATTGKLIQDSSAILDDSANLSGLKTAELRNDDDLTSPTTPVIRMENQNSTSTSAAHVEFRRSRASTADLSNGDTVGRQDYHGRHNSSWASIAKMEVLYTGNGTTRLGDIVLYTANAGAPAERLRIKADGSLTLASATVSTVPYFDASKNLVSSSVTPTELGYVSGVTSAIQTQLNAKQATGNYITALTGEVTASGPGSATATVTNSAVIAKVLTGYVSGAGTVAATDSILQAIQKLNGNDATNANLTGVVTSVGNATSIANGVITNAMLANAAVANLSGTNTGDQTSVSGNSGSTDALKSATTTINVSAATAPSANQVLTATSSTTATWQTPVTGFADPMTTRGDIIYRNASNVTSRLGRGANTYVLTSDGTDISWAASASGGANTALSNLASVAINDSLIFGTSVNGILKTNDGTGGTASENIQVGSGNQSGSANTGYAWLRTGDTNLGTGNSGNVLINSGTAATSHTTGSVSISSGDTGTGTTGSLSLTSGSASGAGTSGNITLSIGTTSGGTRGKIKFVDGSEGTTGHVWTSTDTVGNGHWAAASGGGDMVLASVQTVTGAKTFGTIGGAVGKFILAGSTSGSSILNAAAIAGSTTLTLPGTTGTLVGSGDTGTVTSTMLAGSIALSKLAALTVSRALQTNSSTGAIEVSSVTNTELGYLSGVTSSIQTQIDAKGVGDMVLASVQTVTGAKTFGTIGGAVGKLILAGSTSGSSILNAAAIAGSTTITLPGTTGTLALNPMTTGGDIVYGGASGVETRLANGSSGQVLTSAGGTSAPTWGAGTTAATASTVAGRDANANITVKSMIEGWTTTATAGGTTNMTIASNPNQVWTGTLAQTVTLPTTSVAQGQRWVISNESTSAITVQSSGANTIKVMVPSSYATFTAVVATPTTAANWRVDYTSSEVLTTIGDTDYAGTNGIRTRLAAGTAGQVLQSNGASAPSWVTPATSSGTTGRIFNVANSFYVI
jgi:hypothetical protein